MVADTYGDQLDEMIELFQEYKSGTVTLDNITKLCQTLGLESFIDDIDTETSRLSTASKIIVIDIDFSKAQRKVTDVKLVLASNFDNFNYFIDHQSSSSTSNNILLNSLTQYPDLHEFHNNLKFLYLLDTYSNIDVDPTTTTNNATTAPNNGSGNLSNENTGLGGSGTGRLDLFKYFTELAVFIRHFFADNSAPFIVSTNLENRFGIYISNQEHAMLAKIHLEKSKDPQHRLYEYMYTEGSGDWINESPESYTCGVSLVMEIMLTNDFCQWFPQDFILQDIILENFKETDQNMHNNLENPNPNECFATGNPKIDSRIKIMNDFTTSFVKIKKFDISNDNIDLLIEILNWLHWSDTVLQQLHLLVLDKDHASKHDINETFETNLPTISPVRRRSSVGQKRRRHSNRNRRPSITEAAMLKDEGLQQFNLHEIMTDVKGPINPTSPNDTTKLVQEKFEHAKTSGDVDDHAIEESREQLQLLISEDHVSFEKFASCNLYDGYKSWKTFIEIFKSHL